MRCIVCRRPLKSSASTAAHIGPKCLVRLQPAPKRRRVQIFDRRRPVERDERQLDLLEATA